MAGTTEFDESQSGRRTQDVVAYWTVRNGERFTVALSRDAAWKSLDHLWAYDENPVGWTVVSSMETVLLAFGSSFAAEAEIIRLDDSVQLASIASGIPAPHVSWHCPLCGSRHTTDLCHDMMCETEPDKSPQLYHCERGQGLVLVHW